MLGETYQSPGRHELGGAKLSDGTGSIDILMITHRWPQYATASLERLLATCDASMRVWLWHNGSDAETLDAVRGFLDHPVIAHFHHSLENKRLWEPTNWMWATTNADYVAKVDDDCLVDPNWATILRAAHLENPSFGVVGSWRFYDDDFEPTRANRKIATFQGGHRLMRNAWVQGSGYLMKRRCIEEQGLLEPGQSFTEYCVEVAHRGYINGWYYPFVHEEHLDDPRSALTGLRTDADLRDRMPLSALATGVRTLAEWEEHMRLQARRLQTVNPDPKYYRGWRKTLKSARRRVWRKTGRF